MKKYLFALSILVLMAAPVRADYAAGVAAYGRGDYAAAFKEFKKLADGGNVDAQNRIGSMYSKGEGVPQDYVEAANWYRKAAEQGLAMAQHNLAVMYNDGRGVSQDYIRAHMWYNLAASRSTGKDREKYSKARDRVKKKMTRNEVAEAQRLAHEWKPKKQKPQNHK